MNIKKSISGLIVNAFIERPAKQRGLAKLIEQLELMGRTLEDRFAKGQDNTKNEEKLIHIIAIERWGQNRLKVALGETYKEDLSSAYKPEASWSELLAVFKQTREDTLNLAKEIESQKLDTSMTIKHNQMGDLSLIGWLRYLEVHASMESKSIK